MQRINFPLRLAAFAALGVLSGCGGGGSSAVSTEPEVATTATEQVNTDVVTHHNDLARTGQNLTESTLAPSNVRPTTFGLLRKVTVTGKVDAQPLYLSHLKVGGTSHNVLYVATEHGLVYAFDADTGEPLWQTSLMVLPGETPTEPVSGCGQVSPEVGITSTPVIDRSAGPNGVLYVVAMSRTVDQYIQRIHALDVTTGAEVNGGPTFIEASYVNNDGQTSTFSTVSYKERAALLLLNGVVYTTWASHCDDLPYGGWIIGYDQNTLKQVSALNIGPSNMGPSIWQAGGGPAADSSGNIYVLAANGAFDPNMDADGFPHSRDFGNSFVKISTTGGTLSVADYFSMYVSVSESSLDLDLGSSGPMVLPDENDSTGTARHLAIGGGKDGNLYLVDRESMSKFNPAKDAAYEVLAGATPGKVFANPAYFNHTVYYGDTKQGDAYGSLKAFVFRNGTLPLGPVAQTKTQFVYPGASPSISANGANNAIVWAIENTSPAVLHAYFASDLAIEIYNSEMAAGGRDRFGSGNKYITPTIADGKVFAAVQDGVGIFGLLP